MASPDSTIRLSQVGLEESIDKAIRKVNASGRLKLNINSNSFTQPLGRITAATLLWEIPAQEIFRSNSK